jgi:hypothetical protein
MKTLGSGALVALAAFEVGCFTSSNTPARDASAPAGLDADIAGDDASLDAGTVADSGSEAAVAADAGVISECTPSTGPGTVHQSVNADETWTAAGSPHTLASDSTIYATLTIEPCAELLLAPGRTITVRGNGTIVARGTPTKRIHIGAQTPGQPFTRIRSLGNPLHFAYVDIDGGGDPANTSPYLTGTIDVQGSDSSMPTQPLLEVDHVSIQGSGSNGVALYDGAGFAPGSAELTIGGSAQYPIGMWSRAVDGVPTGHYTGNAHDEIMLYGQGLAESIYENATLHERGVPYLVGHPAAAGTLYVGGASGATGVTTLTIEPGVSVRFKKGGVMYVEVFSGTGPALSALIAAGTTAKPIVFTSDEAAPAAGDWLGIWFGGIPSVTDTLAFARVEYAGGASTSGSASCPLPGMPAPNPDAAIRIFGVPAGQFVTNTTIVASAAHGIDRGYVSDVKQDFLATNTFSGIALCDQTYPGGMSVSCPAPVDVPCPK